MLERIFENVSWIKLLAAVFGFWLVRQLVQSVRTERKIRQLGGHAPAKGGWLPFGIGHIWQSIKYNGRDDNLKLWHRDFMTWGNPANPYTIEVSLIDARVILTADPENIKAMLATQFNDYGKGEFFNKDWHDFLGDSIFATDGKKWHDSRQLVRPQFIKDRVSDLGVFEKHVSVLLPLMKGKGQEVDVKDLFYRYTLDAATDFLLGRSAHSLQDSQSTFAESFGEAQRIMGLVNRAGPFKFLVSRDALKGHLAVLNSFVETYIESALALTPAELEKRTKADEGYTFLHALASYTRDRQVLRDQLVAVLLASRDTTACTLSWLFYELGRNPEIVRKLRREIEDRVGWNRAPTYADLKDMRYLQHTLNETLRFYPVVPYNIRVALQDTSLPHGGGSDGNSPIGLLKDTIVAYSTHYMQHTPEIYPPTSKDFPSPEIFCPERWSTWQPRSWTYIPFNGGPRICVGQQFALTELAYTVVRILQKFSRIEGRTGDVKGPGGATAGAKDEVPWVRMEADGDLVEKATAGDRMKAHSEIVLQPADKVLVAFYE